jgi:hypothetical protein
VDLIGSLYTRGAQTQIKNKRISLFVLKREESQTVHTAQYSFPKH